MSIEAKVIADSVGPKGQRLTTFQLRYPRFIHAELMTHRQFSRNASSSRAVPVERMIRDIMEDTAMPIHWGRNQSGMQAHEENTDLIYDGSVSPLDMVDNRYDGVTAEYAWLKARDRAIEIAGAFHRAKYHKQIVNRILEPFAHISVVVTASSFANFYHLRRHPDAQPEIKALADAMFDVQSASTPRFLGLGDWHLPYITDAELAYLGSLENTLRDPVPLIMNDLIKMSVARNARVSYLTHEGKKPTEAEDLALYERLVGSEPLHASPAEHQATPDCQVWDSYGEAVWEKSHLSGNLGGGWIQYRKLLPGEVCKTYEGV